MNYKIITLKDHIRWKRGDKDTLIERLNEINKEVITFKHHKGKVVVEEWEQKTKAIMLLYEELKYSKQMVARLRTKFNY